MEAIKACFGCVGVSRRKKTAAQEERKRESRALLEDDAFSDNEKSKTFTVLLTGSGGFPKSPWHPQYGRYDEDDNTSHLITKLVPSGWTIPSTNPAGSSIKIRVINPTAPQGAAIKVEYGWIRNHFRKLWQQYGNDVDLVLHLGLANGWEWYTLERSSWKEETNDPAQMQPGVGYYTVPDDLGQIIKDLPGPCPWVDLPDQLFTLPGIGFEDLAKRVQRSVEGQRIAAGKRIRSIDVRPHCDAGAYLCGFQLYESLAQVYVEKYSAKALFCHVKMKSDWSLGRTSYVD